MKILRWIGLTLAVAAFSFFLWLMAIDVGVVHELSQPSKVKKVLADSGLYNTVINNLLDQKQSDGQPNTIKISGYEVATNDPIIKSAANVAFPPSLIQSDVEQVVDSVNDWLSGKTDKPNFRVDLSGAKATFAQQVGAGLQTRLSSLPACTTGSAANFNPFTATCLPKGVNVSSTVATFQSDLNSSKDFLSNPVFTADNVKDSNGQSVFNDKNANDGRSQYAHIKTSPFFIGFLALLAGLAVFFLSSSRRRGLRRIGIVLLFNGLIVLLFTSLVSSGINRAHPSTTADPSAKALQESAIKAGRTVVSDLNHIYYPLGGAYSILGLGLILGTFFIRRGGGKPTGNKPATILDAPDEPTPDEELEPEPALEEPKPAKPKAAPKPKAKPAAKIVVKIA